MKLNRIAITNWQTLPDIGPEKGTENGPITGTFSGVANATPATFSQVSRHDHHNIEIKSVIELGAKPLRVTTEMFLFFPKNFEIGMVGKAELAKDLRTRLRLAIPSVEGFDDEDFKIALEGLRAANQRLDAEALAPAAMRDELPSSLREAVLEAAKDVAAIVAERLKKLSGEHGRQFFMSQNLLSNETSRTKGFEAFARNLQQVRSKFDAIRDAMTSQSEDGKSLNALLDEYISQLYVQYLGAVSREFTRFGSENDVDCSAQECARKELQCLQEDEARYRRARGLSFDNETDLQRERHLTRLSQLKKFFQSKTFIDVAKTQAAKKVTESSALIGTAIAAIIAAILEQWGRKSVATAASHTLIVVALGVILYVIRDRMKDWARVKLQEKALGLVADFETELVGNQRRFGVSREWMRILSSKSCLSGILDARHTDSAVDRHLRLPEDILHTRRVFFLQPCSGGPGQPRALHENVRFNLDRHLKFMDDPFKDLTDLEADGRVTLSRSHRVYHFHIVTKTTTLEGPDAELSRLRNWYDTIRAIFGFQPTAVPVTSSQLSAHRIVLDKSGILRVEPVEL